MITSVDPHGQAVDDIRRCYSSWMRVPEYADPIRVRWWRVPRGTGESSPLSLYVSSNFDETRDFDPPLGEQSTTRVPFADWEDCSPPPWKKPGCKHCLGGSFDQYEVFTQEGEPYDPPWLLTWQQPCMWTAPLRHVTASVNLTLTLQWGIAPPTDGPLLLKVVYAYVIGGHLYTGTADILAPGMWDCQSDILFGPFEPEFFEPMYFLIKRKLPTSQVLATENGVSLQAEGGWTLATES